MNRISVLFFLVNLCFSYLFIHEFGKLRVMCGIPLIQHYYNDYSYYIIIVTIIVIKIIINMYYNYKYYNHYYNDYNNHYYNYYNINIYYLIIIL